MPLKTFRYESRAVSKSSDPSVFTRAQKSWYMSGMLQAFIGTFDAQGLRTLKSEDDSVESNVGPTVHAVPAGSVAFWAILDSAELPTIQWALMAGNRSRAWELLVQQAKCVGRMCG